jgi:hypothetical protein
LNRYVPSGVRADITSRTVMAIARDSSERSGTWSWLEHFDWVPIWIEQQNLFSARACDDIAPKVQATFFHASDHQR